MAQKHLLTVNANRTRTRSTEIRGTAAEMAARAPERVCLDAAAGRESQVIDLPAAPARADADAVAAAGRQRCCESSHQRRKRPFSRSIDRRPKETRRLDRNHWLGAVRKRLSRSRFCCRELGGSLKSNRSAKR